MALKHSRNPDGDSKQRRGATQSGTGGSMIRAYTVSHMHSVLSSLGQISRTPLASLMTIAVIGIALAMPSALHLLLKNFQGISSNWDNAAQVSLFLDRNIDREAVVSLRQRLQAMPQISRVEEITPEQALAEFRRLSDFGDALQALTENPFPTVLVLQPARQYSEPAAAQALKR